MYENSKLYVKKVIYNKALKAFIEEKYEKGFHLGNMNNNLNEIVKTFSLEHIIYGVVKLPKNYKNTLSSLDDNTNHFSEFNLYQEFTCIFYAKKNISIEEFMEGMLKIKTEFLEVYNAKIRDEIIEKEYQRILIKNKNKKIIFLFFTSLIVVGLILIFIN